MIDIILNNFDLDQIANSGQCFRMNKVTEHLYRLIANNRVLEIENLGNSEFRFYCDEDDLVNIWHDYFDLSTNYQFFIDSIDNNDSFLINAAKYGSGIRILKQDPWETLISFIISQRKNIPAIKKSIELLSKKYGYEIGENSYSFPSIQSLANTSVQELDTCSLGYRSKYILSTARSIDNGDIDLSKIGTLNDNDLLKSLMSLYGVGIKVANCVMLFAYHRISSFPIDVWISRILKNEYNDNFDLNKYDGYAGVIQQYMFYYAQNSNLYKNN